MALKAGRKDYGLTLIEVIISLFIFSIGILSIASLQSISIKSIAACRHHLFENVTVSNRLELFNDLPYEHHFLEDKDHGFFPASPDYGPFQLKAARTSIAWEVDDDFPVQNAKRIRVMIQHPGEAGAKGKFAFDYIKSKDSF